MASSCSIRMPTIHKRDARGKAIGGAYRDSHNQQYCWAFVIAYFPAVETYQVRATDLSRVVTGERLKSQCESIS